MKQKNKLILRSILLISLLFILSEANAATPYITNNDFTKLFGSAADITDSKYKGDQPALIVFSASWCPPCKKLAPVLDKMHDKYGKKVHIYKVDTDKEGALAKSFNVSSIPSLLFITKSGEVKRAVGALSQEELEEQITSFLLKK